jgi:hypothetical protein
MAHCILIELCSSPNTTAYLLASNFTKQTSSTRNSEQDILCYAKKKKYMGETFNKVFIMKAFIFTHPRAQHPLLWPLTQRSKSIFQEVEPDFVHKTVSYHLYGKNAQKWEERFWLFIPRPLAKGASVTNCNNRRVWGSVVTACDGTEWGEGCGGGGDLRNWKIQKNLWWMKWSCIIV